MAAIRSDEIGGQLRILLEGRANIRAVALNFVEEVEERFRPECMQPAQETANALARQLVFGLKDDHRRQTIFAKEARPAAPRWPGFWCFEAWVHVSFQLRDCGTVTARL
jgi:hypothetical protein